MTTKLLETARATAKARRQPLLDAMARLGEQGATCAGCTGVCCTFVANSMQVTPLEALDALAAVAVTPELVAKWREVVANNGLDRPVAGDGKRAFGRKRYTCPFFAGGRLGCTLAPEAKPYGCLAYNAKGPGVKDGEHCGSDQALLDAVDRTSEGEGLGWDKLPFPLALLRAAAAVGLINPSDSKGNPAY